MVCVDKGFFFWPTGTGLVVKMPDLDSTICVRHTRCHFKYLGGISIMLECWSLDS